MVVANTHLAPGATPYTIEHFMPREQHEQTPDEQLTMIEALNVVLDGTDERPKEAGG